MKIYLVRHGETIFNKRGRVQGWCDSPLTELGIRQAKNVGKNMRNIPFEKAYCSTLERVVDTAEYILAGRDVELEERKEIKEFNFGIYDGDYEKDVFNHRTHMQGFRDVGGENMPDVSKRMLAFLEKIGNMYPKGNVLVVSHGGSIMNVMHALDHKKVVEQEKLGNKIENCSVTILNYENGQFRIDDYGNCTFKED
ncbi:MAG: histidine phosphatase family protein [Bacillota bacterium]|nr:histidine phosphatase family protein [Bacillota bacterium]